MLGVSLLFLGWTSFVLAADVRYSGQCKDKIKTQPDFDFKEFTKENGGKWYFAKIPNAPGLSAHSSLELTLQPLNEDDLYKSVITSKVDQGLKRKLSEEIVKDDGNGVLTATGKDGKAFKVYFLKYVPSRFAYYYVCEDNGGDKNFDYRFVLSHEPISEEDSAEINKLEEEFNFRGSLRDIFGVHN